MNGTIVYNLLDRYIESEINKNVNILLDDLAIKLLDEGAPEELVRAAIKSQRYPVQSVLRLETEKKKRRKKQCQTDEAATQKKAVPKKRGRRGKGKQTSIENLDQTKYVQAILMNIGDSSYLVDENDIVYNFNQNNEIVGYIKDEQIYWN